MNVYIPQTGDQFNFAQSFARTAQQAAAPAFELQFFATQNAVQDKMAADIEAILSNTSSTGGQTAHLERKIKALTPKLEQAAAYETRAKHNRDVVKLALVQLTDLRGFADSTTVAEFDAKLVETLDMLENLLTAGGAPIGIVDGLRAAKAQAITDLGAIVHNNFASQADIDAAQATIDTITAELTSSQTLLLINVDIAVNTADSLTETIGRAQHEIDEIEFGARDAQRDRVNDTSDYYARILTSLSLAFDSALALTTAISEATIFSERRETGTVLDYFA